MKAALMGAFILTVTLGTRSFAQSPTLPADASKGEALYHDCKAAVKFMDGITDDTTAFGAAVCESYIEGFTDSGILSGAAATAYCFDANTSNAVVVRVYVQYMESHPKLMDLPKFMGLAQALHANYPCK